jgi:hypothetical protein
VSPPQAVPHHGDVPSLSPSIDADLRLIRVHIDQQSQLLAVMHGMLATHQQFFTAMEAQLRENEQKINKLLELVDALRAHLNETTTNTTQG